MENIKIRCKSCNKELVGNTARVISCGCSNISTIHYNERITAVDLSNIVMLNSPHNKNKKGVLTSQDIAWQEERRKRKVRKLDFDVR